MRTSISFLTLCALVAACTSEDPAATARTREQFCADWAEAACSAQVVSACQTDVEDCHLAQQAFCQSLVPQEFSDARGKACIDAVSAAYADADLTGTEAVTVLNLGPPCDAVVRGPQGRGELCSENQDCDSSSGFQCVKRGGQPTGTCQVPELVDPGHECSALQQACTAGYHCNGANCIADEEAGQYCTADEECGPSARCGTDSSCMARFGTGVGCTENRDCQSALCYTLGEAKICVDRIRLSPAEPLCENFRKAR